MNLTDGSLSDFGSATISIPVVINAIVALMGIFGNSCIILLTIIKRNFHKKFNILIASNAFADVLFQLSHLITLYFFLNHDLIRLETCFFIQIISYLGLNASLFMKIAIGVDRFLYFKNGANRYRTMHQYNDNIMFLLIPYVFGMYWVVLAWFNTIGRNDKYVLCSIIEFQQENVKQPRIIIFNLIILLILALYGTIWIKINKMKNRINSHGSDSNLIERYNMNNSWKIMKPLTIIVVLHSFSWLASLDIGLLSGLFSSNFPFEIYSMMLINVTITLNFFIFTLLCKEYQIVLLQIFYWIIGKFQKKFAKRSTNAVSAIAVIYTATYQMENWTSPQDPIKIMDNEITFTLSNRLGI